MKYLAFTFMLTSLYAQAEYRVYQYMVKDRASQTPANIVTSSLNPRAYLAYNGMEYLQIDLMRTWICPGFTGFKKEICNSPYELMKQKVQ